MPVTFRKGSYTLDHIQDVYRFSDRGKTHAFSDLSDVTHYFQSRKEFDGIKLSVDGQNYYTYFGKKKIEVYSAKTDLRKSFAKASGGSWAEEKGTKKRYFIEQKGLLSSSYKEVDAKDCTITPSTWKKVLGLGTALFALGPKVSDLANAVTANPEAAGLALLATQQRTTLTGLLALTLLPNKVGAQLTANQTEFQVNDISNGTQGIPFAIHFNNGEFAVGWRDDTLGAISGHRYQRDGRSYPSEFRILSNTTEPGFVPSATELSDGSLMMFWRSRPGDGSDRILGQKVFANNTPASDYFLIHQDPANSLVNPSACELSNGKIAIVWAGSNADGNGYGIQSRICDSNGVLLTGIFTVNTYTLSNQLLPKVAPLPNNQYVTIWQSSGQDGSLNGIFGQIIDEFGNKVGSEFPVNSYPTGNQQNPSVSSFGNGDFIVAWEGDNQDGDQWGIFAQRFNITASPNGPEIPINSVIIGPQRYPVVAALRLNTFVVVWQGPDQQGTGIFARFYNSAGSPITGDVQVNALITNNQLNPTITRLDDGGFLIAWESLGDIFAQRYTTNARPIPLIDTEFQVNEETLGAQTEPAVAGFPDGGGFVTAWNGLNLTQKGIFARVTFWNESQRSPEFRVNFNEISYQDTPSIAILNSGQFEISWTGDDQAGGRYVIFKRRYSRDGIPLSTDQQVNSQPTGYQIQPCSSQLADGGSVVVWFFQNSGLFGQRFNAFGVPVNGIFSVNTFTITNAATLYPKVAGLSGGGFVVVWTSDSQYDGTSLDISAQRFDTNCNKVGSEFQVTTTIAGDQRWPDIAALPNGGFVIVWMSFNQNGDNSWGIWGQRYSSAGNPVGGEFHVNTITINSQQYPRVAGLTNGKFVIVWQSIGVGTAPTIYARVFASNGIPLGNEFQVEDHPISGVRNPDVAPLSTGGFVVTWESDNQDGDQGGIFSKVFDENAQALSAPIFSPIGSPQSGASTAVSASSSSFPPPTGQIKSSDSISSAASNVVPPSLTLGTTNSPQSVGSSINSGTPSSTQSSNVPSITNSSPLTARLSPIPSIFNPFPPSSPTLASSPFIPSSQPSTIPTSDQTESTIDSDETNFPDWAIALTSVAITGCVGASALAAYKKCKKCKGKGADKVDPEDPAISSESSENNRPSNTRKKTQPSEIELSKVEGSKRIIEEKSPETKGIKKPLEPVANQNAVDLLPAEDKDAVADKQAVDHAPPIIDGAKPLDPKNQAKPAALDEPKKIEKSYIFVPTYEPNVIPITELHRDIPTVGPTQDRMRYQLFSTGLTKEDIEFIRQSTGYEMTWKKRKVGETESEGYLIASGNYGVVWVGRQLRGEQRFVAIKQIVGKDKVKESQIEGQILETLKGVPNIIPFYGESRSDDEELMYQFTHFAGFGDGQELAQKLEKLEQQRQNYGLVDVANGLLNGVLGMHSKKIFHLDLKWDNVVFDIYGETYLIDFGKASILPDGILKEYVKGDECFFPPERFEALRTRNFQVISAEQIDAWGVGVTLLNIVKNRNCFEGQGFNFDTNKPNRLPLDQFTIFLQNELNTLPPDLPPKLAEVIRGLLRIDPAVRMTVLDAHTLLKDEISYQNPLDRMTDFATMKGLKLQEKTDNQE
jgi:predicted Ser/Thr protein kinase